MLNVDSIKCQLKNEEILYISWLDYDPFMKYHFEGFFMGIIDQIKKLKIKKLVMDPSRRRHDPPDADFKEIFELFFSGLSDTEVKMIARVSSKDLVTDAKLLGYLNEIKDDLRLKFTMQNFKDVEAALHWLSQEPTSG